MLLASDYTGQNLETFSPSFPTSPEFEIRRTPASRLPTAWTGEVTLDLPAGVEAGGNGGEPVYRPALSVVSGFQPCDTIR